LPRFNTGQSNSSSSSGGGGSSGGTNSGGTTSSPPSGEFTPSPGGGGGSSGGGGDSGDSGGYSSSNMNRLAPPNLPGNTPKYVARPQPSPVPSRLAPNRDWVIVLDCQETAVVLPGGVQKVLTSALNRSNDPNDNPLLSVVKQMIDRRQASVRPGEAPYQPQIRFLVRPEGLRTYYLAYPALDNLPVPKKSERVDPDPADLR
jgi:hypothetical protein